jgi:RNA polymerase sigma-70 factor (ECF subfamily)
MDRESSFDEMRPRLIALAYRMLGARADAEDVVQEAWLRWRGAASEEVRAPKSYLTTVVARLSLDALKSARRKRETYAGEWLPEPWIDPPASVELDESLSLAFLHILESLTPDERVAFLLREVFGADYAEVAAAVETSEANARQLVARARKHVRDRRPRFTVDPERQRDVLRRFLEACQSGDASALLPLLSAEAELHSDGGGKTRSALNTIYGADRIARFFAGIAKKGATRGVTASPANVNGAPGALLSYRGKPSSVVTIRLDEAGRIDRVFMVTNPEKLPT